MDLQTVKLDLINWLIHLKDKAIIDKVASLKNDSGDLIDNFLDNNHQLKKLLDSRLDEKTDDFIDARSTLNKIRQQHEL